MQNFVKVFSWNAMQLRRSLRLTKTDCFYGVWYVLVTRVSVFLLISYGVIYSMIHFGTHYSDWRQCTFKVFKFLSYTVCKDTWAELFTHHVTLNFAYYFRWCFCQSAFKVKNVHSSDNWNLFLFPILHLWWKSHETVGYHVLPLCQMIV